MKEFKDYVFILASGPVIGMTLYEGFGVYHGVQNLKEEFPTCFK